MVVLSAKKKTWKIMKGFDGLSEIVGRVFYVYFELKNLLKSIT
jgi:hypothetical protein